MDLISFTLGLVVGAAVVAVIFFGIRNRPVNLAKPVRVPIPRYLAGFAGVPTPQDNIECLIDSAAFVFSSIQNEELGRIPLGSVLDIFCEEKAKLLPRLTATKNLSFPALGINPEKPKPIKGYCLVIDWDDGGTRQNAVFEFLGLTPRADAHRVESVLRSHRKPHRPKLGANEKYCPMCAEPIKKDAIICRYCRSHVNEELAAAGSEARNIEQKRPGD